MNNKLIWTLLVTLLLLACRKQDEQTNAPLAPAVESNRIQETNDDDVLTIQFAIADGEQLFYEPLVEAFQAENSNIRVKLVSVDEIRAAAGDTPASLALAQATDVFPSRFTDFGPDRGNVTRDLTPFIQAGPDSDLDDFYIQTIQEADGSIRLWPTSVDVQLIYYNKDAFDAAGLDYPQPGWTWEAFLATANALTIRDGEEVSQWGFVEPNARYFVEGQLTNPLLTASTARFTDGDVVEAVRRYTDLFLADQVTPLPASDDAQMRLTQAPYFASEQTQQLIGTGEAAMWSNSSNALALSSEEHHWGVTPYPVNATIFNTSPIHADGLVMSMGSRYPEAAWRWMNFLSRQNPADFGSNSLLPARVSVAEVSGFWQDIDSELGETLRFALEHQRAFARSPVYEVFNEAIGAILSSDKTVESILADAQAKAQTVASGEPLVPIEPIAEPVTTSEEDGTDRVTIQFVVDTRTGGDEMSRYTALSGQFETKHPNIRLRLLPSTLASSEVGSNFIVTAQRANCFQILSFQANLTPDEQAVILNLDPFIEADTSFDLNDFYPSLVSQYRVQGQLWGLPDEVYPVLIAYNKDLFDAADITYPTAHWTFAEFLDAAIALTRESEAGEQYGFFSEVYEGMVLPFFLSQLGAVLMNDSVDPPTMTFTHPATVEAMRWYADLDAEYGVKSTFVTDAADFASIDEDSEIRRQNALIMNGQVGMWAVYGLGIREFPRGEHGGEVNVGIAPLPVSENVTRGNFPLRSRGYYISAESSQPQARGCWEWIKFLSESANAGNWIPARRSVAESSAFRQRIGADLAAIYLATINHIEASGNHVSFYNTNWTGPGVNWLSRAYGEIVNGEATVEQALETAQQTFDAYRSCLIENNAFNDPEGQNQCLLEMNPR